MYDHTEFEKHTECYNTSTPGGGAGGGGISDPTTGQPGGMLSDPNSPAADPNISWMFFPGSQTDDSMYGAVVTNNSWVNAMIADWDDTPPPNAPAPFSSVQLLNYGANRGWQEGITRNRKCGKYFEESALKYFGLPSNGKNYNSTVRGTLTQFSAKPMSRFRPDHIGNIQYFYYDSQKGNTIIPLNNYFLTEVKATSANLNLSTNSYQIEAELDFLKNRRVEAESSATVPVKVKPIFFLITTADATVNSDIVTYANNNNIWIWYSTAKYTVDANGSPILSYTWPVWLAASSSNYTAGTKVPGNMLSIMPIFENGVYVDRQVINTEPGPNYDVDPEEVE